MCGITGIFGLDNKQRSSEIIKTMNACIAHRGPDDEGFYVDEHVAFGHRRLAIIDLSPTGHQPMQSDDKQIEIIFNGEIYNFREVKALIKDYKFISGSDTEVIIAAYKKWGKNCVHHFNGMFAFAIWDKSKNELFMARDRLGIKPIYYYRKNNLFVFSSEVRAILKSGLIEKKINRNAIHDYFSYQTVHAPQTFVKDVYMLMPGHMVTISNNKFEIEQYWSVVKNINYESKGKSYKEVCEKVNKLFYESVERRLISDVPFGAFLSGGIDSSAVVGVMSKILTQPVKTFTIAFDDSDFSEAKFARMVSDKFKTDHNEFLLKPEDFLEQLPEALNALDHPSGDGPNSYIVSKLTRQAGITMALSGLGGDELFAGYPVFRRQQKLQQQKWLWNIPLPLRTVAGSLIAAMKKDVTGTKLKQLLEIDSPDIENTFPIARQISNENQLQDFISEKYYGTDAVYEIVRDLMRDGDNLPRLSSVSVAEISSYMQNVLLRDTDQMSMAVALEVRVPFLDYTLVEYVLGIDDNFKEPVFPKKLFVDSVGDLLPHEVVHRKKMGFVFPWERWLRKELKSFCEQRIISLANRGFIHREGLLKRWDNFINEKPGVRWLDIWLCVVLEDWLVKNEIDC